MYVYRVHYADARDANVVSCAEYCPMGSPFPRHMLASHDPEFGGVVQQESTNGSFVLSRCPFDAVCVVPAPTSFDPLAIGIVVDACYCQNIWEVVKRVEINIPIRKSDLSVHAALHLMTHSQVGHMAVIAAGMLRTIHEDEDMDSILRWSRFGMTERYFLTMALRTLSATQTGPTLTMSPESAKVSCGDP